MNFPVPMTATIAALPAEMPMMQSPVRSIMPTSVHSSVQPSAVAADADRTRPGLDGADAGELLAALAVHAPVAFVLVDARAQVRLITDLARTLLVGGPSATLTHVADLPDASLAPAVREALAGGGATSETVVLNGRRFERRIEPCRTAGQAGGQAVAGACITYRPDERAQVAHDLRSPLTAIAMWAKFLRSRPLGEAERAQGLDTILRSVEAQQKLIDRFAEG